MFFRKFMKIKEEQLQHEREQTELLRKIWSEFKILNDIINEVKHEC